MSKLNPGFTGTEDDDGDFAVVKSLSDYLKEYWYVAIIGLFWIIYRGNVGTWAVDVADGWFIMFLAGVYMFKSMIIGLKHLTPKVIANPIYSTIEIGRWRTEGNWAIIRLGAIHAGNWYTKGNEGTLIIPHTAIEPIGQNVCVHAMTEPVLIDELPPKIVKILEVERFPKPYYFGFADQETYDDIPELSHFVEEMKQTNRRVNFLEKQNNEILAHVEKTLSGLDRMNRMNTGWKEKVLKELRGED